MKKKGVDNVDRVLKILWQNKMIAVFKDLKGTEYYTLTSDFHIGSVFPKYNLDTIRDQYRAQSKNPSALLKALDLMKSQYYASIKADKKPEEAKAE